MEKRLRSSIRTSAEEFLSSATKLGFRSAKPSLKTLIHSLSPSSDVVSSLPFSLHLSISQSITRFKQLSESATAATADAATKSPPSPPTKKLRRSSRHAKTAEDSGAKDHHPDAKRENGKKTAVENLEIYAYVALMCVSHPKKVFSASDFLPAVRELHDNLILFESDTALLTGIANLCEGWWKEQIPGRETLISQSLPFLLSRSLTFKKKVDVHRVYAIRDAFTLFDFEDESIEDLKHLLMRCVISPLYLKTEEGRRFLSFIFGLSEQLVKEALAMIKSQIPFGRKSMLEAYADIVFRAWKTVGGRSRDEIEEGFLQGLIESAIHAGSGSFAASIRRLLGGFINQRTTDGVENLLFRLAEPVIFRSLQVANSNVRQNALHLLLDLFPLEDPDATKEVKDTLLDKQFFLLERLLLDECPDVRVIAVEGSCRILHLFWEIIPSSTITKLITKFFDDMAHDTSSDVRLSTANGIMYLLGNPHSHEVLKVLLPRLGHLILDSVLSIRAATVDLLLLLNDIQSFQFHKVVQLDVLLATLANDQSLVARKITKLLIPSYFPSKVTLEEACNRCVTLIKRSPVAGARFCKYALAEGASPLSLMELFKVFIRLSLSPDKLNTDQIDALLIAAAYLCKNLVTETSYKAALNEELSGEKLKHMFVAAATGRAQSSVCNIISTISPDAIDGILEDCMELVINCSGLSDNVERQAEVRSVHKMMMSCDSFDYLFEALTRPLQKTANGCHIKFGTETPRQEVFSAKRRKVKLAVKISSKRKISNGKKSSSSSTSRFEEDYANAVGIAWQIKDLLISDDTRKAMLESGTLEAALFSLKVISEVGIVQCVQCEYMNTYPLLAYTSLALHMSLHNVISNSTSNHGTKKKECLHPTSSSSELTLLEQTINHLLDCTNKLFGASDFGKSRDTAKIPQSCGQKQRETNGSVASNGGSNLTKQKSLANTVKMLTAVLKFFVDANAMDLVSHNQERSLKFTLNYIEFIISSLRQHSRNRLLINEEDLKETVACLKSSFTYAAKLLGLVLRSSCEASPTAPEAYDLVNYLLDLVITVEEYLGSGYAARIIAVAKPWLPDLVLGLGSWHVLKQTPEKRTCYTASNHSKSRFPLWLSVLTNAELCEISDIGSDAEDGRASKGEQFSAFRKLWGVMIQLVRSNRSVLDAIGVVLLTASSVGMERKEFELVLGLLHFVCVKLVRHENKEWEELNLMLQSLQEIYPQIEKETEEPSNSDDRRQILESARALLEPIWMCYNSNMGREPIEKDNAP